MRGMLASAFLWMAVAVLWAAPCPAAEKASDDLPAHVDFALRDVRYQVLPDEVVRVYVGPDERAWFVMRGPTSRADIPRVRRLIEREFAQENPQIMQADPILFEPGGRVWFRVDWDQVMAYDGHTWIGPEKGPNPRVIRSECPNHGRLNQSVWADGTAFFADDHGVQTFTGAKSDYKTLFEGRAGTITDVVLVPVPDGKTVLAYQWGRGLWRWRAGEWSEVKLPTPAGHLSQVIPWGDGMLLVVQDSDEPAYFWREGADMAADFAALVAKLGHADFKVREAATAEIIAMEGLGLERSRQALADAKDPEIRARLERIIQALTPPRNERSWHFTLGQYRISTPCFAYLSQAGLLLVGGGDITEKGKSLGQGLVLAEPGGEPTVVPGGSVNQLERYIVGPGKQVWCCPYQGQARLLDVAKAKFTDDGPGPGFNLVQAARADGTLFMGWGSLDAGGVVAYKPAAPDDRRFIDVKGEPLIDRGAMAMADDGSVWAVLRENMGLLSHYDGKTWESAPHASPNNPVDTIVPGLGGKMLVANPYVAMLAADGKIVDDNRTVEGLIEKHAKEFAEAFAPGRKPSYVGQGATLIADKAGHIWLLRRGRCRCWPTATGWM